MLPFEVGEVSFWRHYFAEAQNNKALQVDLDLIEQVRVDVIIMTKAYKWHMTQHFNSKLAPWQFKEGDLVWTILSRVTLLAKVELEDSRTVPSHIPSLVKVEDKDYEQFPPE